MQPTTPRTTRSQSLRTKATLGHASNEGGRQAAQPAAAHDAPLSSSTSLLSSLYGSKHPPAFQQQASGTSHVSIPPLNLTKTKAPAGSENGSYATPHPPPPLATAKTGSSTTRHPFAHATNAASAATAAAAAAAAAAGHTTLPSHASLAAPSSFMSERSTQHAQHVQHMQQGAPRGYGGRAAAVPLQQLPPQQQLQERQHAVVQQLQLQQQQRLAEVARRASLVGSESSSASGSSESAGAAWESGAISSAQALKRYSEYLTPFEQSEILDFPQVFFVGRSGARKIKGNPHAAKSNFGYDDERGDYNVVLHDHLAYRYEVLGILGKGSFGQVLKCHDFRTNTLRAVKVIRNKKRFHHQALVELQVLQYLREMDPGNESNCIHITDHFVFRNHLCISFELLAINLYDFIKHNNFCGLSMGLIRRFAHQVLVGLQFLKALRIIHCDLKPENILLCQPNRSAVKIIDFGSSCFKDERVYTYIQSRFYRSPEVILGLPYGCEIDMWSFGCILAELCTGCPLFPGEDEAEQLACIMEVLGVPPPQMLAAASRRKLFFDSNDTPRPTVNSQNRSHTPGATSLRAVLKNADPGFLDLMEKCLKWEPSARLTPDQALHHPWIIGNAAAAPKPHPPPSTPPIGASSGRHLAAARLAAAENGAAQQPGSGTVGAVLQQQQQQQQQHPHPPHHLSQQQQQQAALLSQHQLQEALQYQQQLKEKHQQQVKQLREAGLLPPTDTTSNTTTNSTNTNTSSTSKATPPHSQHGRKDAPHNAGKAAAPQHLSAGVSGLHAQHAQHTQHAQHAQQGVAAHTLPSARSLEQSVCKSLHADGSGDANTAAAAPAAAAAAAAQSSSQAAGVGGSVHTHMQPRPPLGAAPAAAAAAAALHSSSLPQPQPPHAHHTEPQSHSQSHPHQQQLQHPQTHGRVYEGVAQRLGHAPSGHTDAAPNSDAPPPSDHNHHQLQPPQPTTSPDHHTTHSPHTHAHPHTTHTSPPLPHAPHPPLPLTSMSDPALGAPPSSAPSHLTKPHTLHPEETRAFAHTQPLQAHPTKPTPLPTHTPHTPPSGLPPQYADAAPHAQHTPLSPRAPHAHSSASLGGSSSSGSECTQPPPPAVQPPAVGAKCELVPTVHGVIGGSNGGVFPPPNSSQPTTPFRNSMQEESPTARRKYTTQHGPPLTRGTSGAVVRNSLHSATARVHNSPEGSRALKNGAGLEASTSGGPPGGILKHPLSLGPAVKPLNLSGLQGIQATSAAHPPSISRFHNSFSHKAPGRDLLNASSAAPSPSGSSSNLGHTAPQTPRALHPSMPPPLSTRHTPGTPLSCTIAASHDRGSPWLRSEVGGGSSASSFSSVNQQQQQQQEGSGKRPNTSGQLPSRFLPHLDVLAAKRSTEAAGQSPPPPCVN